MTPEAASIRDAIELGADRLSQAGVEAPRRDARLLLADALGADPGYLIGHDLEPVADAAWRVYRQSIDRRVRREPVSRILGRREFWGMTFEIGPDTLDPRPDSETLVEAALDFCSRTERPLSLLDLGTGSGCLLIALLAELPKATGIGIDRSFAAARLAKANAARLGVAERSAFCVASWTDALRGRFDLIVCNPPYVRSDQVPKLSPEVAGYEPSLALDGGADGLSCYCTIVPRLAQHLAIDGLAILELGDDQAEPVEGLLRRSGFAFIDHRHDLAGRVRCLVAGASRPSWKKNVGISEDRS